MPKESINLFILSTGFHYYYSELLIERLGLENVFYAMYQPREYIQDRAAVRHTVLHTDGSGIYSKISRKLDKLLFARKVFKEFNLKNKDINFYSPYYNDNCVNFLRAILYSNEVNTEYSIIPDGAALMRPKPFPNNQLSFIELFLFGKVKIPLVNFFGTSRIPATDFQHKTGSYSGFIKTIYHFPAKDIYAPEEKIEIIPMQASDKENNGEVLVLGGLTRMTKEFVLKVKTMSEGYKVKFRMHPKNRNGLEYIRQYAPDWTELILPEKITLEEYMIEYPFYKLIGAYSSALVFNHLFISNSRSEFLLDEADDDENWHGSAISCGIPVTYCG